MADIVKTTVTMPIHLLERAKLRALQERVTVSKLMREGLEARVDKPLKKTRVLKQKDPMSLAGIFQLGVKKGETFRRKDMYEDYLKRKMGI
ncbi:hypothetical protein HY407_00160 [Candidatus Gottesmanbacteria bacterium]|nr:hypothetical protein [Candidatus Gottesmanbacteria bacterium]